MVMSSAQIAGMNAAFTQQHMMSAQYSQSIGAPGMGYDPYRSSEGMAARAMNASSAIGAPLAMGGLALMGMDPLSMGLRSGMAAMGAGAGIGGGLAAGVMGAAPMMAGLAGVGYVGNQMFSGAQQIQQFNNNMRGSYAFANPMSQSGRGFGQSDLREIGSMVRGMAGEGGLGGLGPDFNELGRLAANMGRMGLADGVRNAKEFTEKFREMMRTVKTIAEDMGTTLEEAQKTMAAMKGSGIFSGQAGVTGAIRGASVAGGLATTEVTGMMNIGSQISRMYGGTGRQGALGGIQSIAQVGVAQQLGVLSEEDIYNSTGLHGAEGRRALAQQQLMQSGQFLRSGKGRWLLASLAGKDGNLDQDSVADFLSGGMGVNDTRQAAYRNLRGVGRANFIRNEGRLRGSVLEQFGGMAPAMAMMGWAQERGIDINSMGDREMLFMQRQLGMGRDEADALIKMARRLPEIMQARRDSGQDDVLMREQGERNKHTGIEGVKRRLEAARNIVNNEMQKVGQDVLNLATERINEWGNRLAGTVERRSIEGVREAHRAAMMGGAGGASIAAGLIGGSVGGGIAGLAGPRENIGQARYRDHVDNMRFAARMGSGSLGGAASRLVSDNEETLRRAYADGLMELGGEDRIAGYKRHFGADTAIGKHIRSLDAFGQARFVQGVEGQLGFDSGRLSETFQDPGLADLIGGSPLSEGQRREKVGRSMLGLQRGGLAKALDVGSSVLTSGFAGLVAEGAAGLAGGAWGALFGGGFKEGALNASGAMAGLIKSGRSFLGDTAESLSGRSAMARGAAGALEDPTLRRAIFDAWTSGNDRGLLDQVTALRGQAAERGGLSKLTGEEMGKLQALELSRMGVDLRQKIAAKGGDASKLSDADWAPILERARRLERERGGDPSQVTKETVAAGVTGVETAVSQQQLEIIRQNANQVKRTAQQEAKALQLSGVASFDGEALTITREGIEKMRAEGGEAAAQAMQMALEVQNTGLQVGRASSPEEQHRAMQTLYAQGASLYDQVGSLDVKGLRALAKSGMGTEVGGMASGMLMRGRAIQSTARRRGAAGAVAAQLGIDLNEEELSAIKGMSSDKAAQALAAKLGVSGDDNFLSGLQEAISAIKEKGEQGAIKGGSLLTRAISQADPVTKKKLEEQAEGRKSTDQKLLDKIGESNNYLKAIVDSNEGAKRTLSAILNKTGEYADKDPEKGA